MLVVQFGISQTDLVNHTVRYSVWYEELEKLIPTREDLDKENAVEDRICQGLRDQMASSCFLDKKLADVYGYLISSDTILIIKVLFSLCRLRYRRRAKRSVYRRVSFYESAIWCRRRHGMSWHIFRSTHMSCVLQGGDNADRYISVCLEEYVVPHVRFIEGNNARPHTARMTRQNGRMRGVI
ncbi:hypothetical protein HHI36_007542 [Cryptolaemus montrouzieri]|uniref:Uncharacterized protein n=1 Tax=Cryptolaemus montrouzieri TaxID=559131 RepID=A0ABD2MPW4_9CUCU